VENLIILGGRCPDFKETWNFIKNEYLNFFSDIDGIYDKETFKKFYDTRIVDVAVARNKDGKIVCASYVLANGYKSLIFSAYSDIEYRNPKYSIPSAKLALQYFFKKYDCNRIDILGRNDNRVSRLISTKLGFKRIGIIPKCLPHNDIVKDYYYSTILKEEG